MDKKWYSNLENYFDITSRIKDDFTFNDENFSDKKRMGDPIFKSIGYPSVQAH